MKKWIILLVLTAITALTMVVWADTYSTANYSTSDGDAWVIGGGGNTGILKIDPDGSIIFEGATANTYETTFAITDPTADRTITFPNSSGTVALTAGSGNTLDEAYDQDTAGAGKKIDADSGAVEIEVDDGSDNGALLLDNDDTNDLSVFQITNAGSGSGAVSVDIDGQSTGRDIEGTGASWYISGAGAATFASFYQAQIAAAASGNTDLYIDAGLGGAGLITFGNSSTGKITTDNLVELEGDVDIGDAVASDTLSILASIDKDVYIDDGSTDSPALYLKDETDETCAIVKKDDGDTEVTIPADTDFNIKTGNLMVGTGTAGVVAMDGEDMYVHSDAEFNAAVQMDGAVTMTSTLSVEGTTALSENVTFTVAADEYMKLDADTTANTTTAGVLDIDVQSATNNNKAISLAYQLEDGATQAYGLHMDVKDDGTGGEVFDGIYLANSAGTSSTVRGIVMANTLDDGIVAPIAAASQFAVVDAASAVHTETAGVWDISFQTATNTTSLFNIDAGLGNIGSAEASHIFYIDMDDDDSADTSTYNAITVNASDLEGGALVQALYVQSADCALQADKGYVRIGTGETPDVTPGDDDLYIEGTIEVDGAALFDGNISAYGTITGYLKTITDDIDNETLTADESGGVFTNQADSDNQIYTLPTAVAGLIFSFCDVEPGEGADLYIKAATDDIINGGGAAQYYACKTDAHKQSVTLVAVSAVEWIVLSEVGTWVADDAPD